MKSPIKSRPLNNPGESLQKELQDVLWDNFLTYGLVSVLLTAVTIFEWWQWYTNTPPIPLIFSIGTVGFVAFSAWKMGRAKKKVHNLKQGLDGEKAVGQYLEDLRGQGAKVFHDIPGDGFNLDHVIIHESGVYVIETKALSKPDRGEAKLVYDGEHVLKNGRKMDRDAIAQVSAASNWLKEVLKSSTGDAFPIRPVVVYPGWFIESTAEAKNSKVWVLNPKALPSFITHSKPKLTSAQAHMCAHHLSRHIRTTLA